MKNLTKIKTLLFFVVFCFFSFGFQTLLEAYSDYTPRVIINTSTTISDVTQDAFVSKNSQGNWNGNWLGLYTDGIPLPQNPYLQFNVSSLSTPVTSADLKLYHDGNNIGHGSSVNNECNIMVYRVTSTWDESTLTWTNQPSSAYVKTVHNNNHGQTGWLTVDITELMNYWISNPAENYGIKLHIQDEGSCVRFSCASSEFGGGPEPPETIPEPASMIMLGLGIVGLVLKKMKN